MVGVEESILEPEEDESADAASVAVVAVSLVVADVPSEVAGPSEVVLELVEVSVLLDTPWSVVPDSVEEGVIVSGDEVELTNGGYFEI
jgi:hypothetical protein